jgi:hypothetical protein
MNGARCAFIAQRCVVVTFLSPGSDDILVVSEAADSAAQSIASDGTVCCAGQHIRLLRHRPALADDEDIVTTLRSM